MKLFAKIAVPAAIAFASFGAHADGAGPVSQPVASQTTMTQPPTPMQQAAKPVIQPGV